MCVCVCVCVRACVCVCEREREAYATNFEESRFPVPERVPIEQSLFQVPRVAPEEDAHVFRSRIRKEDKLVGRRIMYIGGRVLGGVYER